MLSTLRVLLVILLGYFALIGWLWNRAEHSEGFSRASDSLPRTQASLQTGFVKSSFNSERFYSTDLAEAVSYIPGNVRGGSYIWQDQNGHAFAYAATGLDKNLYFANSYLVGFVPYQTDKVWQPLVTLALRKTYQFDHEQHGAKWHDLWQNSEQAFYYSHGDCEDHAILMADWLISMGYDARVAIGQVPSGGHAWVILFYDEKEYLIEATTKRRPRSLSDFTLAKYAAEYRPRYLFNRENFWVNIGSDLTTRYSGENWRLTASYHAQDLSIRSDSFAPDSPTTME